MLRHCLGKEDIMEKCSDNSKNFAVYTSRRKVLGIWGHLRKVARQKIIEEAPKSTLLDF